MAQILLTLTDDLYVQPWGGNDCLLINFHEWHARGTDHVSLSSDRLYLHGTIEQVRAFAQAILAALPVHQEVDLPKSEGNPTEVA